MGSLMSIASDKKDGDWVEGAAADFDFVRFTMSDINGVPRSKLIPRSQVNEKLKTGVGIPSGEIHHCREYCLSSGQGVYIHHIRHVRKTRPQFALHNFKKCRHSFVIFGMNHPEE